MERVRKALTAANLLIRLLVKRANLNVDIKNLQKKYGASGGRVFRLYLKDLRKNFYFVIQDGRLVNLPNPKRVDGVIVTRFNPCLIDLLRGKMTVIINGKKAVKPYGPLEMWRYGDVETVGEISLPDVITFLSVFNEVAPIIKKDLADVIG